MAESDTGWLSPASIVDSNAFGTAVWSNPSNARFSDDSRATCSLNITASHALVATDFGLDAILPPNVTILEVQTRVERSYSGSGSTVADQHMQLWLGGLYGSDRGSDGGLFGFSDAFQVFGAGLRPLATWWGALTRADVVRSDFGFLYTMQQTAGSAITGQVDTMQLRLLYEVNLPLVHASRVS